MRVRILAAAFVVSLSMAGLARAQTTPPTVVPVSTPLTVEWESEHTTALVTFRALVDGAITKNFAVADLTVVTQSDLTKCTSPGVLPVPTTCFTYRGVIPGVARGPHSVVLRADNELGTANSDPLAIVAGVVPRKPGLPRVSVTATVAGLVIELKDQRGVATTVLQIPNPK